AGLILWTGRRADAPTPVRAVPSLTVTTASPQRVIWPRTVAASGVVAPWQEASVGTQIGSYQLVEVNVEVGDQVRRGQVLARLNPALLRAEEAQLLARHDQAQINSRRAQVLRASGGVSEQEVLAAETEAKAASALLAAKRLELRYTAVLAPDDGVITARSATLGAVAPAGQELFRMIRRNRLEWRGELTAEQLRDVAVGQFVTLSLPDGTRDGAVVRRLGPAMDAPSRLGLVYADVARGGQALAGMYVAGAITVGMTPALIVPAQCVVIREGRSYVMMVDMQLGPPGIRMRRVRTGRRDNSAIEILSGLTGTERLVLSGAGFLNDGDVVRVAGSQEKRSQGDRR
uniref:efflux RND transporter periplasmic adaptor subunit n=1 Tax=uncultured Caulobacter sp. TaxID=158749 RepID=UPI0025DF39A9